MQDIGRWGWLAVMVVGLAGLFGLLYWLTATLPPHEPPHDRAGGGPGD